MPIFPRSFICNKPFSLPLCYFPFGRHRMASHGITEIPPELLGDIFFHCSKYCPDAPVILSIVCKRFRSVALGTPQAWTSLRLSVNALNEREDIRKAGLWLSLARACCVDLFIDIEGQTTSVPHSHPFLIAFLQHHTERIGCLNVRSQSEQAAHSFLNALYCLLPFSPSPSKLPLKTLRIRISARAPGQPATSAAMSVFHSLELLPQLKSLQLTNHLLPSIYTPDLHNLQSLSVVRPLRAPPITLSQLVQIIEAAPQLIELEISARVACDDASAAPSDLYIADLKRLSLRTNHVPLLLETLIVPSLEELHINDLDGRRLTASADLMRALQLLNRKLGPLDWSLRVLEVTGVSIQLAADIVETSEWLLGRMKKLEELSFPCSDEAFGLLVELLMKQEQDTGNVQVCPALRHLRIAGLSHCSSLIARLTEKRPEIEVLVDGGSREGPRRLVAPGIGRGFGFGSRFAIQRTSERIASPDVPSVPKAERFALVPDIEDGW